MGAFSLIVVINLLNRRMKSFTKFAFIVSRHKNRSFGEASQSCLILSRNNMFRAFEPKPDRKNKTMPDKRQDKFIKRPEDRGYELTLHPQPREERMSPEQDWTAVWPTAQVFKPSVVPLPLRAGRSSGKAVGYVPLSKYANVELLKINNFLHLTPPAIEKHCQAIKKFMTKFPEEVKNHEVKKQFFPLEITTSSFCFSGPAVRHPDSRICTMAVKLSDLSLSEKARNKLILLLKHRYNRRNDTMTIVTDRCPTRKQNTEYALYLLNVLYHECNRVQKFEENKTEHDDEKFIWSRSEAKAALEDYLTASDSLEEKSEAVDQFEQAVSKLVDSGETEDNMDEFKKATVEVFGLKSFNIDN